MLEIGIFMGEMGASQVAIMVKNLPVNAGDAGLIPEPGEENGNPLQYFCLGNSMDRGAWWVTVHGMANSWMQLSH